MLCRVWFDVVITFVMCCIRIDTAMPKFRKFGFFLACECDKSGTFMAFWHELGVGFHNQIYGLKG